MQRLLAVIVVLAVAGCAEEQIAKIEVDLSQRLSPGCYTVDLFDPYRIEYPSADVPPEYADFLGVWKNGAWGGTWCHDLYVTNVTADGVVTLLDAHGPSADRGAEATVFKRTAQIEDGVLSFLSYGSTPVSYRRVGDYLVGERKGFMGKFEVTMSRVDGIALVPVPPSKPVRRS